MSDDTEVKIYSLDDLQVSPELLMRAKVFKKAKLREEYEILIPDEESDILLRDLKSSPFRKQAERLVSLYLESDANVDYLAQNQFYDSYFNKQEFILPWLIPIVKDKKLVYKKKYIDELTVFQDNNQLNEVHRNILNYANVDNSQVIIENLHNYQSYTRIPESVTMTNHSGAEVLRIKKSYANEIGPGNLQFRGSYGDWKITQLMSRKKTARKEVIIGRQMVDRVIGESLEVIGFAKLPITYPNVKLNPNWFVNAEIQINPEKLDDILRRFLPNVSQLFDQYNTNDVTDIRAIIKVLELYGHNIQSLTQVNRKQIADIIRTNISLMKAPTFTRTDRLEYKYLDKELAGPTGSGILSQDFLDHPALIDYRIIFESYPHIYHRYLKLITRLDNGEIWTSLLNPNNTPEDVKRISRRYNILILFKEIASQLESSYMNMLARTPPDMSLFDQLSENPLDSISDLRPDKRDQIAWFQYFKQAYPDRQEKNYYFRGKWIGCQHQYDQLYQKFEDVSDPYPFGKRYTRITPHNGVVCGFCGDILIEDNDTVDQGYDQRGQKINTYDNDSLLRTTTAIDVFLKKDKSEVVKSGEKLVEQWINISEQKLAKYQIKALKYELLRQYEEAIVSNKFTQSLQQNPNKIMKASDRELGEFIVNNYKITDFRKSPTSIFLQKLFQFFYNFSSIFEIVIQRLAVYLTILNWHLVQEDPVYLNASQLLSNWTLEEIGKVFMNYNINGKAQMLSLKNESTSDSFFDFFAEKAGKGYRSSKMSVAEFNKFLKQEYKKYRSELLYTPNEQSKIFNGVNPLEHEIIRIYSEYRQSLGKSGVQEYLFDLVNQYWDQLKEEKPIEVKNIEENARIANLEENKLLNINKIKPSNRPLFDRALAQRKIYLSKELEQMYVDLVNDNIYNIKTTGATDGGAAQVIMKKMYILNKMNCDDWSDLESLGLIGLEEETVRMSKIMKIREEIISINERLAAGDVFNEPFVKFTGGNITRDNRENPYTIYHVEYIPPNYAADELVEYTKMDVDITVRADSVKVADSDFPPLRDTFNELSFVDKIRQLVNNLGNVSYLPDLTKFNERVYAITNGQMNGTEQCNTIGTVDFPYPKPEEFKGMYQDVTKNQYMKSKLRLNHLKKYIISHVRHHIYLFARITDRNQFVMFGLEKYMYLYDYEDFTDAFIDFNDEEDEELGPILTNKQIEDMVVNAIPNYDQHQEIADILQLIFVTDIIRHLRRVRNKADKFVRGKTKRRDDQPDSAEIFIEFIRILMDEIRSLENVVDVNFNHLKINQMFMNKIMWNKMDKAEKRGELEWKILRHNLNISEFEETIAATGNQPEVESDATLDQMGEEEGFDMENDQDDYNDGDMLL